MEQLGISRIRLRNFKGIGPQGADIAIRPITLFFGANSAGKSTVLQALHYLRDVLERHNADPDTTLAGGARQDLGGFQALVHKQDLGQAITIGVEIRPRDEDAYWDYFQPELVSDEQQNLMAIGELSRLYDIERIGVEVTTAWNDQRNTATVVSYRVSINGTWVAKLLRSDHQDQSYVGPTYKARCIVEDEARRYLAKRFLEQTESVIDELDLPTYDPAIGITAAADDWSDTCLPTWGSAFAMQLSQLPEDGAVQATELLKMAASQMLEGIGRRVLAELQQVRYIGPLRSVPERHLRTPRYPDESRWSDGHGAWDVLSRAAEAGDPGKLIPAVNEWLESKNRLGTDYRIEIRREIVLDADGEIIKAMRRFLNSYDDLDSDDFARLVWQPLQTQARRQQCLAIVSRSSDLPLTPADIGVGISQVLPFIVAAHAADRKIIAIEQPELHIHPAMQVALGDLAIEAAYNRGVNTLIETHSEHLVLRLMRRLRETFQGGTADRPPITPKDICILLVEADPKGTCIREMPLNELGQLVKAWPGGFFEEGFREQFGDD